MNSWPRARKFVWQYLRLLAILIVLPAFLFGVTQRWQVIFLMHAYMIFLWVQFGVHLDMAN